MDLKINFDASFIPETRISGISVVIKTSDDKYILRSSKKVICNNNIEAEFRALNKAVGYINNKQGKGFLPKNCRIMIYGDNKTLMETSAKMRKIKCIEKGLMSGFLSELTRIKENNEVVLIWILRNENKEAHSVARGVLK